MGKSILLTISLIVSLYSQYDIVKENINYEMLSKVKEKYKLRNSRELISIIEWTENTDLPTSLMSSIGKQLHLIGFTHGQPRFYTTYNKNASGYTNTSFLIDPIFNYNLTGAGVSLGMWDVGIVDSNHVEFSGNRIINMDDSLISIHATHVAGTMIAAGVNTDARGMAINGTLKVWDYIISEGDDSHLSEMVTAQQNDIPLLISNHSYGTVCGWIEPAINAWPATWIGDINISTDEDYKFGFYDSTAMSFDEIAFASPYYLIVKAVGNDKDDFQNSTSTFHFHADQEIHFEDEHPIDCVDDYDCIPTFGNAKNILTVGAIRDLNFPIYIPGITQINLENYSGTGPTDDGRIKPDIVGNGDRLFSSISVENAEDPNSVPCSSCYAELFGTSMASPNVAGSLALIQEYYISQYGVPLRADVLKGIVLHTAHDIGAFEGPDYKYGWGLLNARGAVDLVSENNGFFNELSLYNSEVLEFQIENYGEPLKVTICWTDPPGLPPPPSLDSQDIMLVNDLDLVLEKDGEIFYPFVLNPTSPDSEPGTGNNNVDNMEQVYLNNPVPGNYTVRVNHEGMLENGYQDFAMVISGAENLYTGCIDPLANNYNPNAIIDDGSCFYNKTFHSGWNWVGFPRLLDNEDGIVGNNPDPIEDIFNIVEDEIDYLWIENQLGENADWDGDDWNLIDNLTSVISTSGYKVELSENQENYYIPMIGVRVPINTPIDLVQGENWVPYFISEPQRFNDAFPEDVLDKIQMIKSENWFIYRNYNGQFIMNQICPEMYMDGGSVLDCHKLYYGAMYEVVMTDADSLVWNNPNEGDEGQYEPPSPLISDNFPFEKKNDYIPLVIESFESEEEIEEIGAKKVDKYVGAEFISGLPVNIRVYDNNLTNLTFEIVEKGDELNRNSEEPKRNRKLDIKQLRVENGIAFVQLTDVGDVPFEGTKLFSLVSAYPNPMNPGIEIQFSIMNDAYVNLEIYDMLGRKLKTLIMGNLISGNHFYQWDGKDENRHPLSSGIYFFRLQSGDEVIQNKIMLLK